MCALAHHENAIADAHHLRQIGGDDADRQTLFGKIVEDRVDLALGADIDAARRLVDQQHAQFGSASQRARMVFCWLPPDKLTMS